MRLSVSNFFLHLTAGSRYHIFNLSQWHQMSAMLSQITWTWTICSTACSGQQHIIKATYYWPLVKNFPGVSPHKEPVAHKAFRCHGVHVILHLRHQPDSWHIIISYCKFTTHPSNEHKNEKNARIAHTESFKKIYYSSFFAWWTDIVTRSIFRCVF